MAKYRLKTRENANSVSAFISAVDNPDRKRDAKTLLALMKRVTNKRPKMWGGSIVGFGSYSYTSKSGIEGSWPLTGFSPRKTALTIYIMPGFKTYSSLMKRLGTYTTGSSCLYVKRLSDIDTRVLEKLVRSSVADMKKRYGVQ